MANTASDRFRAFRDFHRRHASDGVPVVLLPSRVYADTLAATRAGAYSCDFGDEDGLCDFFIRDGDLHLRNADGVVKPVTDMLVDIDEFEDDEPPVTTSHSPRGRFLDYCHSSGVTTYHGGRLIACLKNDALLDNFVGFKPEGNTYAAFIYVAKHPGNLEAVREMLVPLRDCVKSLDIFVALVQRENVDIWQLVQETRLVPLAETNERLQNPDVADALMIFLRDAKEFPPEQETVPLKSMDDILGSRTSVAERTADTPRGRFLTYCHSSGATTARGAIFLRCLKNDALLDNFVAYKPEDNEYPAFIFVAKYPGDEEEALPELFSPLSDCLKKHDVLMALVQREDVDILQLVQETRRVPIAETAPHLNDPEVADAVVFVIRGSEEGLVQLEPLAL